MINLKNKYCLVTGCNGYIGKAICQKLIKLGAIVIYTDVKKNKIKSKNSFFFFSFIFNLLFHNHWPILGRRI